MLVHVGSVTVQGLVFTMSGQIKLEVATKREKSWSSAHLRAEYSQLANSICILSPEEAGRLEHFGIWPACKSHIHVKKSEAAEMIAAETHRFVGGTDTRVHDYVSMIVPVVTGKMWCPVPACNNDGSRLIGFRTWGLTRSS